MLMDCLDEDPSLAHEMLPGLRDPPLVAAVRKRCSPELLQLLLDRGAEVDAIGCEGLTAMDCVVGQADEFTDFSGTFHRAPFEVAAWKIDEAPPLPSIVWQPIQMTATIRQRLAELQAENDVRSWGYSIILLQSGLGRGLAGASGRQAAAQRARANGKEHIAHLLEHWAGEEADALKDLRVENTPSAKVLQDMPNEVFECICNMLAPTVITVPM